MNEREIKSIKDHIKTTKNNIFATFKVEDISNLVICYEQLQQENKQLNEVIDEILNTVYFNNECPYSLIGDGCLEELCDCDNCQDTYKECWLKYFKNRCKGDKNGN